jgi:4-hydroxybenzoate polyprenyltransferase
MADVLAGYLIVFSPNIQWVQLMLLMFSSACIYAGGCAFNDACDWRVDAVERPFRPIPSNRISRKNALRLTSALFVAGLIFAALTGWTSFAIAFVLVFLCISYDALAKHKSFIGPLNMGACRALNLVLGASPHMSFLLMLPAFPVISLVYVFSLTSLSRFEAAVDLDRRGFLALVGWGIVPAAVLYMVAEGWLTRESLIYLGLFALFTGLPLMRALVRKTSADIIRAVKMMVLGYPFSTLSMCRGSTGGGTECVCCCLHPRLTLFCSPFLCQLKHDKTLDVLPRNI